MTQPAETTTNGAATAQQSLAPRPRAEAGEDAARALSPFTSDSAFAVAQRMAKPYTESGLVPPAYQGQAGLPNVLIAMELANRIGASVFMVMQNIDIIHGRPAWRAVFLLATVNTCGRFTPLRFRFEGKPGSDDWGCRAVSTDKATGEELAGPLITIALAKAEGWYQRNGSKWKTLPELMLMYRSGAFWTRVYAPELSLGMHTSEEVADMGGIASITVETPAAILPGNTHALEAELLQKPAAPVVVDAQVVATSGPETAKPTRSKAKPAPEPAQAAHLDDGNTCAVCHKEITDAQVPVQTKIDGGGVGLRHEDCSPFGNTG